jgi:hypothetical protein
VINLPNTAAMVINSSGNVGIGTTAPGTSSMWSSYGVSYPSTSLDVNGFINSNSSVLVGNVGGYTGSVTNAGNFFTSGSVQLMNGGLSGSKSYIGTYTMGGGGGVGFILARGSAYDTSVQVYTNTGAGTAQGSLNAAGPYVSAGGNSWTSSSDSRLKTNWQSIDNVLENISTLTTGTFEWISTPDRGRTYGLIAQEVQQCFPELISIDDNGYLGIQYSEMVPILTKAVQELKDIISTQNKRIEYLENLHSST